jgi:glycosyltransferase involved in cell wall biosynthesis
MILLVAPYSPIELSDNPHLGAARKIEMVIEALSTLNSNIVLVNTAHNSRKLSETVIETEISGIPVKHYSIKTYANPRLGKLFNLKDAFSIVKKCLLLGNPDLVWIYNGYSFENLFSTIIKKKVNVPVVLEFEDWHFSRSRGINPKPYIDYIFWRINLKNINFAFGVNDNLVKIMSDHGVPSAILPGIVPARLTELCDREVGFSNEIVRIGYFGGLSEEKGVDSVIKAISKITDGYIFVVSGAGPLERELDALSISYPDKLEFHGRVTEKKLYELIASVDVILNPHSPINDMSQGVFPFKVVEAVASGKLLITTELPAASAPGLLDGAVFYDGSVDGLVECIVRAKTSHKKLSGKIQSSTLVAREYFSMNALLKPIRKLLNASGGK